MEASKDRDESIGLSLKIGMAVAIADGSLDDTEGDVLKSWIVKSIEPFSDEKRAELKGIYNQAMRESYEEAITGDLILSNLTNRLNEIGEKATKYETLELCFEVMSADGVADTKEWEMLRNVAQALDLDMDEISKMRDQSIVSLDNKVGDHASIEVILGIEQDWTNAQVRKHLNAEFQKWNNRLSALPEGKERDNAQLMLHKVSEARIKYA